MASSELLQGLIEATLAGSAAILLVLLLRRPLRRASGAQVGYALWLLVPLAMWATLLPAATVDAARVPAAQVLALPQALAATAAPAQGGVDWRNLLLGLWLLGALAAGGWLWRAQAAFRRSLGPLLPHGEALRAQGANAGLPATLGLWKPQIVLPADFETRFDAAQRALVLAHEQRHIARRDAWANAAAALLRCLFWFDPLFHFAAARMRHDQELACDADVLAAHPQRRRAYGDALLNTQLALQTAPLGCHFGFGHPLKERIAMLATPATNMRRRLGGGLLACLLLGGGYAAWATQPATPVAVPAKEAPVTMQQDQAGMREVVGALARDHGMTVDAPASLSETSARQGTVDDASRMLHPPRYPEDAAKQKVTGTTVLIVAIDERGDVTGVTVERSAGDERLDEAAQEAAMRWKFRPEIKNGKAVAGKVRVPVEFAMDRDHADLMKQARAALARHARGPADGWVGIDALVRSFSASWKPRMTQQEDDC